MKHRSAVFSALAGLSLAAPLAAVAQDEGGDRRFYAAPMFTYVLEDQRRGLKNGLGGTLAFGKKLTNSLNFEISGYYYSSKPELGGGANAKSYGVGGGFMLFPVASVSWLYVPLDLYSHWGRDQYGTVPSYRSTVFDSGLGLQIPLVKSASGFLPDGTSLRIEARYRYDLHGQPQLGKGGSDSAYDGVFSVGLLIPFTHLAQPVEETPPPATEVVPAEGTPAPEQAPAAEQAAPPEGAQPSEQAPPPATPAPEQQAAPAPAEQTAPAEQAQPSSTPAPEQAAPAPAEQPPAEQAQPSSTPAPEQQAAPAPAEQKPAAECRPPQPGEQVTMEGCAAGPAPAPESGGGQPPPGQ